MTKEAVEAVIGKAMLDPEFSQALLADPDRALAPFDLTEAEKASLKSIDGETIDALAHTLDTRVAKVFVNKVK